MVPIRHDHFGCGIAMTDLALASLGWLLVSAPIWVPLIAVTAWRRERVARDPMQDMHLADDPRYRNEAWGTWPRGEAK